MIALKISDTKTFMNRLLLSDLFDHFLLSEAVITKDATYTVNGRISSSFYSREEREAEGLAEYDILPYARLRPVCYQMIRGKYTPVYFKFVLLLSPANTASVLAHSLSSITPDDVSGIFLNVFFQNGVLTITTGISYTIYVPDRELEHEWDAMAKKFLHRHAIAFEEE